VLAVVPPGATSENFVTLNDVDDSIKNPSKVDAYNKKKLNLYFQGEVRYTDSGRDQHFTSVCTYHVHGWQLYNFNACPSGNGMDTEPGWAETGSGTH
jgi:hypothetical protein